MNLPTGFTASADAVLPLHVVDRARTPQWRDALSSAARAWLEAHAFDATPGTATVLPGDDGVPAAALLAVGDACDPFAYAHGPKALPARDWTLASPLDDSARSSPSVGDIDGDG